MMNTSGIETLHLCTVASDLLSLQNIQPQNLQHELYQITSRMDLKAVNAINMLFSEILRSDSTLAFNERGLSHGVIVKSLGEHHVFTINFINGPLRKYFATDESWPKETLYTRLLELISKQQDSISSIPNVRPMPKEVIDQLNKPVSRQFLENLLVKNYHAAQAFLNKFNHWPSLTLPPINTPVSVSTDTPVSVTNGNNYLVGSAQHLNQYSDTKSTCFHYVTQSNPQSKAKKQRSNPEFCFGALISGYGRIECVDFFERAFEKRISTIFKNPPRPADDEYWIYNFIHSLHTDSNEAYVKQIPTDQQLEHLDTCGVALAIKFKNDFWISNCGDLHILRSQNGVAHAYSVPQFIAQPINDSKYYGNDVIDRGGKIAYVWEDDSWVPSLKCRIDAPEADEELWEGLKLAHALGRPVTTGIVPTPDIYRIKAEEIGKNDILIVYSHHISKLLTPLEIVKFVHESSTKGHTLSDIAREVVDFASGRALKMDAAMMIINLNPN